MASALRLGSAALRSSTRAPARSVAFNGLRCYSSKTAVSSPIVAGHAVLH